MYIYKAGVIGAGLMGAEIAQVMTYAGLPVILKDVNDELVQKGIGTIRKIYERRAQKGKMTQDDVEQKLALVTGTTSMAPLKEVDIVIEAVPEKMPLKKQVLQELDAACQPSTIFATNTSALSISELAGATTRPAKVIGMHFFFPAHVMKLVEVIPGLATDEETINDVISFTETLRKIPVRVNECAGFLVNRLLMPYLNEAAFCLQEGASTAKEIDAAMVQFGWPMGPFTLVDSLGLDVCREVVGVLLGSYGVRMAPAAIWEKLYARKRFGQKTGAGFYNYDGSGDGSLNALVKQVQGEIATKHSTFSAERLLFPMINEAALCVQEQVSKAADIDMAVVAGLGFPQAKEGLLKYADAVGLDVVVKKLDTLYQEHGERFWPAPLLRRLVAAGFTGKKAGRGFFEYT